MKNKNTYNQEVDNALGNLIISILLIVIISMGLSSCTQYRQAGMDGGCKYRVYKEKHVMNYNNKIRN